MAVQKPTKQQIAQAKARASGNTTSKTTPARMAKGAKDIALFAAGIVGPGKAVKAVSKVAKVIKAESKAANAAQKVASTVKTPVGVKNPLTRQGRSVKVVSPTSKVSREKLNAMKDAELEMRKSGFYSKSTGKAQERWNKMNPGGKKPTINQL
jgi:hypothetical protein